MNKDELQAFVARVRSKIRVTKVVATRSVKTKRGDFFCGMAAAWNTVQDDAGGEGADMDLVMHTAEFAASGMTLQEAKVAHNLVALQADIGAYEAAFANGGISQTELDNALKGIKNNYSRIIRDALVAKEDGTPKP